MGAPGEAIPDHADPGCWLAAGGTSCPWSQAWHLEDDSLSVCYHIKVIGTINIFEKWICCSYQKSTACCSCSWVGEVKIYSLRGCLSFKCTQFLEPTGNEKGTCCHCWSEGVAIQFMWTSWLQIEYWPVTFLRGREWDPFIYLFSLNRYDRYLSHQNSRSKS